MCNRDSEDSVSLGGSTSFGLCAMPVWQDVAFALFFVLVAASAFAHRAGLRWTLASPTVRQIRMLLLCPLVAESPPTQAR